MGVDPSQLVPTRDNIRLSIKLGGPVLQSEEGAVVEGGVGEGFGYNGRNCEVMGDYVQGGGKDGLIYRRDSWTVIDAMLNVL